MNKDKREQFIEKWFIRGHHEHDAFDKFFYLWIALIVAAQSHLPLNRMSFEKDSDKVKEYFKVHKDQILYAIKENKNNMVKLACRKGIQLDTPILDALGELQKKFSKLSAHYVKNEPIDEEQLVKIVAELLNRIRNNLFHGRKIYDDKEDIELLGLVNPLLFTILLKCEGFKQ